MRNSKKKPRDPKEELISSMVFRKMFDEMLSRESSAFGKLLLQENLISHEIIILLFRINLYIHLRLGNKTVTNIDWNRKTLEEYTLGGLITILQLFLDQKSYPFVFVLRKYNVLRNKLTHKIFTGYYKSIMALFVDARVAVKLGDKLLEDIRALQKLLLETSLKKKIIKYAN